MKGKEDYAKKLKEIMTSPDDVEDDVLPELDYSKSAKRLSKVLACI